MNILGVVQARMGSSRLPGKAMLPIVGKPLIWHVIDRVRRTAGVGEVRLATTTDPRNDALIAYCGELGIHAYRHEKEDDLAGRIAGTIAGRSERFVLKAGGDCPLIDPDVMSAMVSAAERTNADFCSNRVVWSYPLGLSADVLSRSAIEWADRELSSPSDRELFALYIRDHPDRFRVTPLKNQEDQSHHNWCVDTQEDLIFVRGVFDALYEEGSCFGLEDVLAHLQSEQND